MTDRWPWPGDRPVDRARKIANSLLARLPERERDELTARAHALGETWLGSTLVTYTPDQPVTTERAAEIAEVSRDTIRHWACVPHPEEPDRPLLRRYRRIGRQMTYLAGDVLDAAAAVKRAKRRRSGELTRSA